MFDADGLSRIIIVDCTMDSSEVVGDSQAEMEPPPPRRAALPQHNRRSFLITSKCSTT